MTSLFHRTLQQTQLTKGVIPDVVWKANNKLVVENIRPNRIISKISKLVVVKIKSSLKPPPITLPETNIAPENRSSQKETSIPTIHFHVLC